MLINHMSRKVKLFVFRRRREAREFPYMYENEPRRGPPRGSGPRRQSGGRKFQRPPPAQTSGRRKVR